MSLIDPFPHHPFYVLDDSEMAVIMMVDSNSQRTRLLSSERPFAYKMKLDVMKRQDRYRAFEK